MNTLKYTLFPIKVVGICGGLYKSKNVLVDNRLAMEKTNRCRLR